MPSSRRFTSIAFMLISVIATLMVLHPAKAIAVSIDVLSANQISTSDTVSVHFRISGLTEQAYDSLSGFDFDVLYDDAVLRFVGQSFTDSLTSLNQLDFAEPGGLGFYGDVSDFGAGTLEAFGVSGNSSNVLDALQTQAFTFLTLDFVALSASTGTAVGIDLADPAMLFLNSDSGDLPFSFGQTSSIIRVSQSGPTPVPEPSTLALIFSSLPLAYVLRRRVRN